MIQLKKKILLKLNNLYGAVRENITLTMETLDNMVAAGSVQRMSRAIELYLPPITRLSASELVKLYENIRLLLNAA